MNNLSNGILIFREDQRFCQPWLMLIIVIIPLIYIFSIIDMILWNESSDLTSASNIATLFVGLVIGTGLPALFLLTRLTTEVRADGIYVRFSPFHRSYRNVSQNLVSYEIRQYRPIREYGGWGIRGGKRNGAYNVRGNMGLQLMYANSSRLLIGTQRPGELIAAVHKALK